MASAFPEGVFQRNLLRIWSSAVLLALFASGAAQAQFVRMDHISTGSQPLGFDLVFAANSQTYLAVANSGDNSLSIFQVNLTAQAVALSLSATVTGIPSPYAVANCGANSVLVTSPSDNSVRLVQVPSGKITATLNTGPQPYSAACHILPTSGAPALTGVVSNAGDNSLSLIDIATFTIRQTFQNVPAGRGFHGVSVLQNQLGNYWIALAGTDGNLITIIDPYHSTILGQLPVAQPTAVFPDQYFGFWASSSATNTLFAFYPTTGEVIQVVQNVPNPQDAVASAGGTALTTVGGMDAICWIDRFGNPNIIPGVPSPAQVEDITLPSPGGNAPGGEAALATSTSANVIDIVYLPVNAPADFAVQSAAASVGISPGALASAYAATGATQNFSAGSVPLSPSLGGVSVNVGGNLSFDNTSGVWSYSSAGSVQAPLLFVGPKQINLQIPPGIAPGSAIPVQIVKADGTTLLTTVNLLAAAPGIFTVLMNGQGQAAALNQDNVPNFATSPAARGSVIQIFATGAGATTPSLLPGQAADPSGSPLVFTNDQPTVSIGGINAQVMFSGMAPGFVGLWQINAVVSQSVTPGNAVPLSIAAGGITSNTVNIAVQ